MAATGASYGGGWTVQKLDILEHYLDAYTTALKKKPFKLMYIDAFAGTGYVELGDDATEFIRGSAMRAVLIRDKPFDKLVFVETDPARCAELEKLKTRHLGRDIHVEHADANHYLKNLRQNWNRWRGVLFLDPFATEVEWSSIERIAQFNALDTWIMFPVSAITRMLPISKRPDNIAEGWVTRLTKVFGDESWRELYRVNPQMNLFGDVEHLRDPGVDGLLTIYKKKLASLFGDRFLLNSRTLKNSKNSALFELLFCVGNNSSTAVRTAKSIARYIVDNL